MIAEGRAEVWPVDAHRDPGRLTASTEFSIF
jgi:hypothetical protein